ncbi:MAG TPA: GT4 family glycosyltransferase PelF [Bacteroidota bacterium]|nr:GT4 family glycosyltransferase PelF [Bacteroidota bacterium]
MTDVCLILEGTYPFRVGGVTTWVDTLVKGLPDLSFSIAHLYYGEQPTRHVVGLPPNVKALSLVSLNEMGVDVLMSDLVGKLPEARLYHALSTGFAGLLGTEMKNRMGKPFILTEHGIYWHEVSLGADELECGFKVVKTDGGELQFGRTWETWYQAFQDFAKSAYTAADTITTVCSHNKTLQQSLGAAGSKIEVIPNGVRIPDNGVTVKAKERRDGHKVIALVGRVTAIKDVKTFIRACALVQERLPEAEFLVVGPMDHDPAYVAECKELTRELGLRSLRFTGELDMCDLYPTVDLTVLTSISEAQPYAVLESFAYGIPVVVTDVGGCPELVNGGSAAESHAGIVCPVGDARSIADAIIELSTDELLYERSARGGLARARSYYSTDRVIASYGRIYSQLLKRQE